MTTKTAPGRRGHSAVRRRGRALTPPVPRRVSGPLTRPAGANSPGVAARPAGRAKAVKRERRTLVQRLVSLPDHRFLDRLLRGRLWIPFIAVALLGIVTMQISLLKLNRDISRAVQATATLEHQSSALQARITELASSERINRAATTFGMVLPEAGDAVYVDVRGKLDSERAIQRMTAPTDEARAILASRQAAAHASAGVEVSAPSDGQALAMASAPTGVAAPAATTPTTSVPVVTAPVTTTTTAPASPSATAPASPGATGPVSPSTVAAPTTVVAAPAASPLPAAPAAVVGAP